MKILVLIPSRYGSTRFPGKPLAMIAGKSLIQHCYDNFMKLAKFSSWCEFEVAVVTDSEQIENHLKSSHSNCVRVDDETESGSERIFLAYQRFFSMKHFDFIVNVQGDEPLLLADDLKKLIDFQKINNFEIATLCTSQTSHENFINPNFVKVVRASNGQAIYFSRSPIPYNREEKLNSNIEPWLLHAGVYSYTPESLIKYNKLETSNLEKLEKLEQLRAIENNISIGVLSLDKVLQGVDTPEDINNIEKYLN